MVIQHLPKAFLALACLCVAGPAWADYPVATIKNNSDYTVSGTVEYASAFCKNDRYSVRPGGTWRGRSRGVCLITGITGRINQRAKHGETASVVPYDSTGTSYSKFQINAFGGRYRIFSRQEFKKVSRTEPGKSPGFRFVNKTEWPVAYSLEQVGCLYHDVIPRRWNGKNGVRRVDTGAVWFTLRMHIQPDGKNPRSDWDCVEPVAEIVGDVLLAAMSGGAGAAMAGPKFVGKQLAKKVIKKAAKKAFKASVKSIRKTMKDRIGQYLKEAGTVTMGGQYAGYDWPFRCNRMPEYHITGGPTLVKDEFGAVYVQPGKPFKVTKVNGCGNDMMRASPRSKTAQTNLAFPDFRDVAEAVRPDPARPEPAPAPGPRLEADTDLPGADLQDFDLPRPDPRLCRQRCQANRRCKAFTYAHPGAWGGRRPHCWLKHSVPAKRRKRGNISGVVRQERRPAPAPAPTPRARLENDTDRPGADLQDFDLPRPDPNLCRRRCEANRRCKAFTYAHPGAWGGRRPHCWLKHGVPAKRRKRGNISGVVRR